MVALSSWEFQEIIVSRAVRRGLDEFFMPWTDCRNDQGIWRYIYLDGIRVSLEVVVNDFFFVEAVIDRISRQIDRVNLKKRRIASMTRAQFYVCCVYHTVDKLRPELTASVICDTLAL